MKQFIKTLPKNLKFFAYSVLVYLSEDQTKLIWAQEYSLDLSWSIFRKSTSPNVFNYPVDPLRHLEIHTNKLDNQTNPTTERFNSFSIKIIELPLS